MEPITTTIPEFSILSGLNPTKIYSLIAQGDLQSVKIGKRRLVVVESYRRIVEQKLAAEAN